MALHGTVRTAAAAAAEAANLKREKLKKERLKRAAGAHAATLCRSERKFSVDYSVDYIVYYNEAVIVSQRYRTHLKASDHCRPSQDLGAQAAFSCLRLSSVTGHCFAAA